MGGQGQTSLKALTPWSLKSEGYWYKPPPTTLNITSRNPCQEAGHPRVQCRKEAKEKGRLKSTKKVVTQNPKATFPKIKPKKNEAGTKQKQDKRMGLRPATGEMPCPTGKAAILPGVPPASVKCKQAAEARWKKSAGQKWAKTTRGGQEGPERTQGADGHQNKDVLTRT